MTVAIIIPAHNEEKIIGKCIESILSQSYKEISLIVSCDNCTDDTAIIAKFISSNVHTITVYETINNKGKRSGAINQAIANTNALDFDYVVAFDADSILEDTAIEKAVNFLDSHPEYVSTCSFGKVLNTKRNYLVEMQNMEYGRFNTERIETQGKLLVSHGLCSMFRSDILKFILYTRGFIYDEKNIIEDYELTQYIKNLGYKVSVYNFDAYTDVPEDFKTLYNQRKRWIYGSLTVLKKYPVTIHNIFDRLAHIWAWFMIIISSILSVLIILNFSFNNFILLILGLNMINSFIRLKYATWRTWKTYLLVFTIIPELIYNLVLTFIFIMSYYDFYIRKKLVLKNDNYV